MTPDQKHHVKNLINLIGFLRQENTILQAKVEMVETFQMALLNRQPNFAASPNGIHSVEALHEYIQDEEEEQALKDLRAKIREEIYKEQLDLTKDIATKADIYPHGQPYKTEGFAS